MDNIEQTAISMGWTPARLAAEAVTWLRDNGHADAFVKHLEAIARDERGVQPEPDEEYDSEEEDGPPTDG